MVGNVYGIRNVTIDVNAKCFCPLGNDWYTNQFHIDMDVANCIPDYVELDKWVDENINGQSMIIEAAVAKVREYIVKEYKPISCTVRSYVDDAKHSDVCVSI